MMSRVFVVPSHAEIARQALAAGCIVPFVIHHIVMANPCVFQESQIHTHTCVCMGVIKLALTWIHC